MILATGGRTMGRDRWRWLSLAVGTVLVLVAAGCTTTSAKVTSTLDPGVKGCDVLLTAPVGHDCLLPWPNNAFTVGVEEDRDRSPAFRLVHVSIRPT